MPVNCSIPKCERVSHALCHGCQSNFCREHMAEHDLATHLELTALVGEANQINTQLTGLNETNIHRLSYQKLEEWRQQCHQQIDVYFNEKTQELDGYINEKIEKYKKELSEIQAAVITHTREQETTHEQVNLLAFQIRNLQREVKQIEQNHFQMHIKPLIVDKDLIHFDQLFGISTLPPVYRVIDRDETSCTSLATNYQYLLLYHQGTLLLVDGELTTYKQVPWTHGPIYDMCYSRTLKRFVIINENEAFLLNEENMSVNQIRSIPWQQLFSCTCSDTSLYLSTKVYKSSILQFNLSPSIVFVKRWESLDLCAKDEGIDGIVYNDNKLALMISNDSQKNIRIELRHISTLIRLWLLELDIIYNPNQAFRFCLLNHNEWLVADHSRSRLVQITKDGTIKSTCPYIPTPCCAIEFGHQMLAISTKTVVHLHKL